MHWIKDVKYLKKYKLLLTFENDEIKEVNLEQYLDGDIFSPLQDINFFKQVYLNQDIDTIVWSNNADFSPDFLYQIGQ
ncbi:MAG: DUF2442 domain-containing protein [bacterium]|nr:DUF2442 domain-containing protein [bacterium]